MNAVDLGQLDADQLADYLWRRLRFEPPVDPPLARRFGPEPPEQFILQAVEESDQPDFRARVLAAICANLRRLAVERAKDEDAANGDPATDQQTASLAFLIAELDARETLRALYLYASAWLLDDVNVPVEITDAYFHVLRTLARLQTDATLAGFWKSLWHRGPRSIRGLVFFGWVRADSNAALAHLDELIDSADEIDLPTTLWSLVPSRVLGISALGRAAHTLSPPQRTVLANALRTAGADQDLLQDFDLTAGPAQPPPGEFQFPPGTAPKDPAAARVAPHWSPIAVAA